MTVYSTLSFNAPDASAGGQVSNGRRVYVGNLSYRTSWMTLKDVFRAECGPVLRCDVAVDESKLMPGGRPCSKGWGIVEFESELDAAKALQTMTDYVIDDRPIFVREDRESSAKSVPHKAPRGGPGAPRMEGGFTASRPVASTADPFYQGMAPSAVATNPHFQHARAAPMGAFARNRSRSRGRGAGKPTGGCGKRLYVGNLAFTVSWQDLKDHFKAIGAVRDATVATDGNIGTRPKSKGFGFVEYFRDEDHERALQMMTDTEIGGRKIWVREDRDAA
eukprot:CAMPEP_0204254096 /NCGR_PEP_ID=MMETSP0468-20130131/2352_1 /ASSEMBLY_ACC=CAM_ASM_000383 /TAXON_ID=2969 /ORGANISM="Oxyrrhis marina" /LENGTH=276 /DNA_ID=CAMNT_0051227803 /DNA_START=38 /DNA_END=868 /DNA_ORIENTATION=-